MTLTEVRKAVYDKFLEVWKDPTHTGPGPAPDLPVFFDNEDFDLDKQDEVFATASVQHIAETQTTIGEEGNRFFENTAALLVAIYIPSRQGLKQLDDHAEVLRNGFRALCLPPGIYFNNGVSLIEQGIHPSEKFFIGNIQGGFTYESVA